MAFLLVGAIVGAGFASGREILSFFGGTPSILIAPVVGAVFFLGSVLFLSIGRVVKASNITQANLLIMGNKHIAADIFLLFNGVIILGGKLAAMNSLFRMVLPDVPFVYAIAAGLLCAVLVARGLNGLLKSNAVLTPLVIVIMVIICVAAIMRTGIVGDAAVIEDGGEPGFFRVPFSFSMIMIYMSMNMMLASTVLTTIHTFSKKQVVWASAIASVIVAGLMAVLILALNSANYNVAMPLILMAQNGGAALFYAAFIAIALSVFTSMMTAMIGLNSWLRPITGGKWYSILLVLIAGLILSMLGFENVIAFLYPVIGVIGFVYIGWCIVYLVKNRKNTRSKDKLILKQLKP